MGGFEINFDHIAPRRVQTDFEQNTNITVTVFPSVTGCSQTC